MNQIAQKLRHILGKRGSAATPATATPIMSPSKKSSNVEALSSHKAAAQNCDSGLESLPPEVRRHLLSVLDLPCMKALVRASPVFHQQYLLDRRYLLCASMGSTLQGVCLDAYAVQRSKKCVTPDQFIDVMDTWGRRFPQASLQQLAAATTETEAVHMVSEHLQIITPTAKCFAKWASDELARQTKEYGNASRRSQPESRPELSQTEWLRCLRATYRLQLLCNVASPTIPGDTRRKNALQNAELLFHTLTPWEVEELFSVYQFAYAIYDEVFNNIQNELRPDNPRFADQHRPPTPDGAFELDDHWARHNFLEGTILQGGLNLLATVLFDIIPDDHERLVSLMQRSIVSSYIPINAIEGILGETQQILRRHNQAAPEDRMTEDRAPLPFTRDDLSGPPLAWTIIWAGTYSNLYGHYTSDEMRRWAYVFWDAERMERWGGRDLLTRQWEKERGGDDPRDNIW